jgi:hypothetical protein
MEFMLLIVDRKGAPVGAPVGMAEMGKFAGELSQQGKLRGGAPLHPEAASRAQAIELATRCPHAKWGTVEVREVMEVRPR